MTPMRHSIPVLLSISTLESWPCPLVVMHLTSHPPVLYPPASIFPTCRVFSNESLFHQVAKPVGFSWHRSCHGLLTDLIGDVGWIFLQSGYRSLLNCRVQSINSFGVHFTSVQLSHSMTTGLIPPSWPGPLHCRRVSAAHAVSAGWSYFS